MANASHYQKQVTEILGAKQRRKALRRQFSWDSAEEAKTVLAQVRQMQKRLRLVKKDVNAEMKAIRAAYNSQASNVSPGIGATVLLGKGKAKSIAAAEKRSIRSQRDAQLGPYAAVKRLADEALVELDRIKQAVSRSLEQEKVAAEARKAASKARQRTKVITTAPQPKKATKVRTVAPQPKQAAGPRITVLERTAFPDEFHISGRCPDCGTVQKKKGQQFCTSCGAKLVAVATDGATSEHGDVVMHETSRGRQYRVEIRHRALDKSKTIKGDDLHIVEQKARAMMKQWNEEWLRKEEKARAIQAIADKTAQAEKRNLEAQEALMALKGILAYTLDIDDTVDWETLKDYSVFSEPEPEQPIQPQVPREPQQTDTPYKLELGLVDKVIASRRERKEREVGEQFQQDHRAWADKRDAIVAEHKAEIRAYEQALVSWRQKRDAFLQDQTERNVAIETQKADYLGGDDPGAIIDYCDLVLSNSKYPDYFPQSYDLDYSPENKILIVDYQLPPVSQLPTVKQVRYVKSRDVITESHISQAQVNRQFNEVSYQIALRTLHELYEADKINALASIVFNGYVQSIDLATGQEINPCILSVQAGRDEFDQLNLALVDPAACFKSLKGVGSARLQSMTPIAPILRIDRDDARFIESYGVADELDEGVNLAAMDWEDFEHLIREMFEKEFASTGGEVKVTRASRDGGVDAVAFDPDPIRGGKIVIQAKRYTGTVGVSAVRDLYGTVVNEGATKGIIVTTSHYGPDAYEFARGKPLTLLDGNNLLSLLERHGHKAKIDIQEARRMLREG